MAPNPLSYRGIALTNAWLTGIFGVLLLVVPVQFLGIIGVEVSPATVYLLRGFATALLFVARMSHGLRDAEDPVVRRSILVANIVQDALLAALTVHAILTGVANGWAWPLVAAFGWEVFANAWAWRTGR